MRLLRRARLATDLFTDLPADYYHIDDYAQQSVAFVEADTGVDPDWQPVALLMAYAGVMAQRTRGAAEHPRELRQLCRQLRRFVERDIQRRAMRLQDSEPNTTG